MLLKRKRFSVFSVPIFWEVANDLKLTLPSLLITLHLIFLTQQQDELVIEDAELMQIPIIAEKSSIKFEYSINQDG
jgi:hypothetical protein